MSFLPTRGPMRSLTAAEIIVYASISLSRARALSLSVSLYEALGFLNTPFFRIFKTPFQKIQLLHKRPN